MPPISDALSIDSGTVIVDADSGVALERIGERSTIQGAVSRQLEQFRVPEVGGWRRLADPAIAFLVVGFGAVILMRRGQN